MAKKPSRAKLKKKLWKLLTPKIKERDGYVCQSCGAKVEGANAQGGHLIAKSVCGVVLCYMWFNLFCQCYRCNINAGGNSAILNLRVSKKLGYNVAERLEKIRRETKNVQWNIQDLQQLIECLESGGNYEEVHARVYGYAIM